MHIDDLINIDDLMHIDDFILPSDGRPAARLASSASINHITSMPATATNQNKDRAAKRYAPYADGAATWQMLLNRRRLRCRFRQFQWPFGHADHWVRLAALVYTIVTVALNALFLS